MIPIVMQKDSPNELMIMTETLHQFVDCSLTGCYIPQISSDQPLSTSSTSQSAKIVTQTLKTSFKETTGSMGNLVFLDAR